MAMAVPSHPWRPAMCLSARACLGRLRLASRPAHLAASLVSLARPVCSCRGAGRSGVGSSLPAVLVSFSGRLRLLLASDGGDECVDCVNCLSSVDYVLVIGYILYRALSMVRRLISLVFSVVA